MLTVYFVLNDNARLFTFIQFFIYFRILTTPNEKMWPGVSKLKNYKVSFPTWNKNILKKSIKKINNVGLDLLQVINYNIQYFRN